MFQGPPGEGLKGTMQPLCSVRRMMDVEGSLLKSRMLPIDFLRLNSPGSPSVLIKKELNPVEVSWTFSIPGCARSEDPGTIAASVTECFVNKLSRYYPGREFGTLFNK